MLHWGDNKQVLVLCYHNVGERTGLRFLETQALTLEPKQFARQIRFLSRFLDFISPTALWSNTTSLPPRPTLLSFDDGTQGLLDHALPVLKQNNIQSLCFVGLEHHRDPVRPYWWDLADSAYNNTSGQDFSSFLLDLRCKGSVSAANQLQDYAPKVLKHLFPMNEAGLKQWALAGQFLASHGNTHDPVASWQNSSASDPKELQEIAGAQYIPAIAYPYGELPANQSIEPAMHARLEQQGFRAAFGTWGGLASLSSLQTLQLQSVPRLLVPSQWSNLRLAAKIVSLALRSGEVA